MARMNRVLRWLINRQNARRSAQLAEILAPQLRELPPSASLLEIGAGRGGLSGLLVERLHPARMVVTDLDPAQVEAARRGFLERFGGLPAAVELRTADLMALPFPPSSFDAVFAIGVLHHVEPGHSEFVNRPAALREIRRVVAPAGLFVYSEFTRTAEVRETLLSLGFRPVCPTRHLGHQDVEVYRKEPSDPGSDRRATAGDPGPSA